MAKNTEVSQPVAHKVLNETATLTVTGPKSVLTNHGNEFCSMNPVVTRALDPEGRKLRDARLKAEKDAAKVAK